MLKEQATDIWFTANPKEWSRDSAVRSFRVTDWSTTQQDLQLSWLNTTCREAKSFSKNCTSKRFGVNTFIWAFLLKNVNQNISPDHLYKTAFYSANARRRFMHQEGVRRGRKANHPTPQHMSSRGFCVRVVVLMENSFCSYTKRRWKAKREL